MVSGNRSRTGGLWPAAAGTAVLTCLLASSAVAHGQDAADRTDSGRPPEPKKPAIEVFRGTVRTDGRGRRLVTSVELRRATERARRARRQAERRLKELAGQSAALAAQSYDSFNRGLMPLPDHLEQLTLAQRAELLAAHSEKDVANVQRRHIERLDAVVSALREFNQPNAQGWKADLLLAQTLAADARARLATLQKRDRAAAAARNQALALAQAHLQQRQADSTIGLATVPMLVNAQLVVQQVRQNEPYTALPADEFLEDAVALTRSWQARDAGIGRADRVALAEYQQARFALRHGLNLGTQQIARLYQAAETAALRLYDQQRKFLHNGTASLYDVARAWNFRSELTDILSLADLAPPESSEQRLLRDLDALQQLARGTVDRRGRIEADLSYIGVLSARQRTLQALDSQDAAEAALEQLKEQAAEDRPEQTEPPERDSSPVDPPVTAPRRPKRR